MPNPLQIGPLQLTLANPDPQPWGMLTIGNDTSGSSPITLLDNNGDSVVGVINQAVGSDGSFKVTFQYGNQPGLPSLTLSGKITSSVQVSGNYSLIGGILQGSGTFTAQLLPIRAPFQTKHTSPAGTLIIDPELNLYYMAPGSGTEQLMGSAVGFLNVNNGSLARMTISVPGIGDDTYTWIEGTFFNSVSGRGTLGPCSTSSPLRQQGDDTWTPILTNK